MFLQWESRLQKSYSCEKDCIVLMDCKYSESQEDVHIDEDNEIYQPDKEFGHKLQAESGFLFSIGMCWLLFRWKNCYEVAFSTKEVNPSIILFTLSILN